MPTECITQSLDFGTVEGRRVEAAFDGGLVTSDAGGLLLGATDRAIRMMDRFASCFHDERRPEYIEHEVATLVGQRVFGIALGYEDLNDHDELRHDPMMAILAGKLTARREDCAPVAGKSTLNRLELSKLAPTRYHKISHNPVAIKNLLVGGCAGGARLRAHQKQPLAERGRCHAMAPCDVEPGIGGPARTHGYQQPDTPASVCRGRSTCSNLATSD